MSVNEINPYHNRYYKILLLLLITSLMFWLLTIATTYIYKFPPDVFFYAKQLGIYYWIGIVILFIAILLLIFAKYHLKLKNSILLEIFLIFILVLFLFGTPSFIYHNPRFSDVYGVITMIDALTAMHHTPLGDPNVGGYMGFFPGTLFFFSFVKIVSGLSLLTLAKYYPIYLMLLSSLLVYYVTRRLSNDYAFLSPVCYLSLAWTQEYHLSPQSLALILYASFWLFIIIQLISKRNFTEFSIISLILLAAMIVSHPLTPLVVIINLSFLFIASFLLAYLRPVKMGRISSTLLLAAIFMFFGWCMLLAIDNFANLIFTLKTFVGNLYLAHTVLNFAPVNPQPDAALVNLIREVLTVVETAVGGICTLYLWRKRRRVEAVILGSWFVSCYIFFMPGAIAGAYFGRTLIFSLFPFSVLIALAFSSGFKSRIGKTIQICVLLLIFSSAILIPVTNYGGDYFEFVPDSFLILHTKIAESNHSFLDFSDIPASMSRLLTYSLIVPESGINTTYNNITYNSEGYYKGVITYSGEEYYKGVVSSQTIYNYYQVRASKGREYTSFFEQQGLSKLYTTGDTSIYKKFQ